jgi:hypothetical protein
MLISAPGASLSAGVAGSLLGAKAEGTEELTLFIFINNQKTLWMKKRQKKATSFQNWKESCLDLCLFLILFH